MTESTPENPESTEGAGQTPDPGDSEPPYTDPEPPETEPEPESPPPTPDPIPDPDPIAWEPQTWYSITAACRTPGCVQENRIVAIPMFYSNNGDAAYCRVVCASDEACGQDCTILTAAKLDPQPIQE